MACAYCREAGHNSSTCTRVGQTPNTTQATPATVTLTEEEIPRLAYLRNNYYSNAWGTTPSAFLAECRSILDASPSLMHGLALEHADNCMLMESAPRSPTVMLAAIQFLRPDLTVDRAPGTGVLTAENDFNRGVNSVCLGVVGTDTILANRELAQHRYNALAVRWGRVPRNIREQ